MRQTPKPAEPIACPYCSRTELGKYAAKTHKERCRENPIRKDR